jgi:hypothetical protein
MQFWLPSYECLGLFQSLQHLVGGDNLRRQLVGLFIVSAWMEIRAVSVVS